MDLGEVYRYTVHTIHTRTVHIHVCNTKFRQKYTKERKMRKTLACGKKSEVFIYVTAQTVQIDI
jgi:hypothetical protein